MERKGQVMRQTYSAPDVAEYLGISRTGAYNLMQAAGFPSFRIGGRVMVTRAAFETWLEMQQTEPIGRKEARA